MSEIFKNLDERWKWLSESLAVSEIIGKRKTGYFKK